MIYGNIILTVRDEGDIAEIRSLLSEQRRQSLMEPGCERFEVYQSQADAKVFILVERWASQQALDDHRLAKAYNELYKPKVLPRVDRVPHLCTLVE